MSSYAQFFTSKDEYRYHFTNVNSVSSFSSSHRVLYEESTLEKHVEFSEKIIVLVSFEDHHLGTGSGVNDSEERTHVRQSTSDSTNAITNNHSCKSYICRLSSLCKKRKLFFFDENTTDPNVDIIQFDESVYVPLYLKPDTFRKTKVNQETQENGNIDKVTSVSKKLNAAIDQLKMILGGNHIDLKPIYYIINMIDVQNIQLNDRDFAKTKDEKRKFFNKRFCRVKNWNDFSHATSKHKINGFVLSITSIPSLSTIETLQKESCPKQRMNVVPIPLLSASLSRIYTNNDNENTSEMKEEHYNEQLGILLLQCLKRQLVGKLVTFCPSSSSWNEVTAYSNPQPHHCIIHLDAPNTKGKAKPYYFQLNDVLPYKKVSDLSPSYSPRSSSTTQLYLYQIMPSTRIVLDMIPTSNDKRSTKMSEVTFEKNEKIHDETTKRAKHEDLLIKTIEGIRYCSDIYLIQKQKRNYSLDIPRVFLLSGSPGVGKTYSVRKAIEASNNEGPTNLISIRGSELLANGTGSDAANELTKIFNTALSFASKNKKSISLLFMDECDALFTSDIVSATLASFLDQMSSKVQFIENSDEDEEKRTAWKRLLVVAATNRIDAVPAMLRRPGRFDREVCISPPDTNQRFTILKNLLNDFDPTIRFQIKMKATTTATINEMLGKDEQLMELADLCVGYVASDLAALVRKAIFIGIKEGNGNNTLETFKVAMKEVGASALRDSVISAPPATRWDDIAGDAGGAKTALRQAIEWPKLKRKQFESLGLKPPRGILLHGPPGCAKTTLVRAAAGSVGVAFLSLSPADVYASSYVGEAEAVVRRAFSLARSAAPCILFFDEIDTIVGTSNNQSGMDRGTNAEARVLSTFLNEMDGVDGSINDGVLVLGATNRPSTLDAAILRPGRFDRVIYVPPPDQEGRQQILQAQCRGSSIDVEYLSREEITGSMTGAEIVGACREAAMLVVREIMATSGSSCSVPEVSQNHLEISLKACKPLLSDRSVLEEYTKFEDEQNKK